MLPILILFAIVTSVLSAPSHSSRHAIRSGLTPVDYPVQSCSNAPEGNYFSCTAPGEVSLDSCCYENYGVIMQTQFWDSDGTSLTNDVFTIHGLWDDTCDGSYHQYCDKSLEFSNSDDLENIIVDQFGRLDLYDAMSKYWLNSDGSSESLWVHEYNKHGTCFNTLRPACFTGSYKKHENAIAFFQKVVEVWQQLPTYKFLEKAGITPSSDSQYSLLDIQAALKQGHSGSEVYVGCENGKLSQIYYYYHVKGNVLNGEYEPIDTLTESLCPDQVWYLPK